MSLELLDRQIGERAKVWNEMEAIVATLAAEGRAMNAEETARYDQLAADFTDRSKTIQTLRAHAGRVDELATVETTTRMLPGGDVSKETRAIPHATPEYRSAFMAWMQGGMGALDTDQRAAMQRAREWDMRETRAQTVTTTGGGYLIPQGFEAEIVAEMKQWGGMLQANTRKIDTDTGNDLPVPTVADTGNVGRLLTINTQVTTTDVTFGQIMLKAYVYTSDQILVPWQLMQDSAFDMEGFLREIMAERIGRITNLHYTTGTGTNQPQGIVTGASSAATAGSATSLSYNDLVTLKHSIDPAYRAQNAEFMFNDTTLAALTRLTDDIGRPLIVPSVDAAAPDRLLGHGYIINQDVADPATGNKAILFGAMRYYWIRRVTGIQVVRMDERYADFLQTGFFAFVRTDGRLADPGRDPIKFLTMA